MESPLLVLGKPRDVIPSASFRVYDMDVGTTTIYLTGNLQDLYKQNIKRHYNETYQSEMLYGR